MRFMQGRYGFDEYGRFLSTAVIVLIIVSIVLSLVATVLARIFNLLMPGNIASFLSTVVNWVAIAMLVYLFFRVFSRNHEKRRAENARFLERRSAGGFRNRRGRSSGEQAIDPQYSYLDCQFCGQRMRVPRGKGKIAVRCPSCGERTITSS